MAVTTNIMFVLNIILICYFHWVVVVENIWERERRIKVNTELHKRTAFEQIGQKKVINK